MSELEQLVQRLNELLAEVGPKIEEIGKIRLEIAKLVSGEGSEQPVR